MKVIKVTLAPLLMWLISGCTVPIDKFALLKDWNDKWQVCSEEKDTSVVVFPKSEWFDNLSLEDQKKVFVYIHFLKGYQCTEVEARRLKAVLDQEEITTLNEVLKGFIYFEPPSDDKVSHLDTEQIEMLAKQIEGQINPLKVAREIGLIPKE